MTTTDGKPLFELLPRQTDGAKEPLLFKCLKCDETAESFTSKTMPGHAAQLHHEVEFIVNLRNLYRSKKE